MKFIKKLLPVLCIVVFGLFNAQTPGAPCGFGPFKPCPAPPSPIDMYVYVLAIIAIIAIIAIAFFAKKYKTQKI